MRVPSGTLRCGICDDAIHKGSNGPGKAATTPTCMCDHYFCYTCLGKYVANKINSGAVTEEEMCLPSVRLRQIMLVGFTADGSMQFTPNYLYTSYKNEGRGILGKAFSNSEARKLHEKFLHHRNRISGLYSECPSCNIGLVPPQGEQFVRCQWVCFLHQM